MKLLRSVLLLTLLLPWCGVAGGLYVYRGNPYQMCIGPGCVGATSMTATIEVSAPLAANTEYVSPGSLPGVVLALLHWSISDGVSFISDATPDVSFLNNEYRFVTDNSGRIVFWDLAAGAPVSSPTVIAGTMNMPVDPPVDLLFDNANAGTLHYAATQDSPGAWALATPEPRTFALALCGLLAVMSCGKRSQRF